MCCCMAQGKNGIALDQLVKSRTIYKQTKFHMWFLLHNNLKKIIKGATYLKKISAL
jgi:hypothetical protein